MAVWLVTAILIITLILLITEKLPVDLTAIGVMVALMTTGILSPLEAVAGFANPAVITVGAMFLISKSMIRTGAVGFIGETVIHLSRGRPKLAMLLALLIVAFASGFINNTPVVVLFIPIIMSLSCAYDLSPSKLLIPVSYASILAGTCTLIGTSTNIIVSDLSLMYGYGKLGIFELTPLGVPIALLGIGFIYFASSRLMPGHATPVCEVKDSEHRRYLAEFVVGPDSPMIGRDPQQALAEKSPFFEVFEIIRKSHIIYPWRQRVKAEAGDTLLVKGSPNEILGVLREKFVDLHQPGQDLNFIPGDKESVILELIIPPQSALLGERLLESTLHGTHDIHIIAVKRREVHYIEQKIRELKIKIGDILLVQCHEDELEQLRRNPDFIVVEDVHHEIIHKKKAPMAGVIFAALIIFASTGLADIMVCALAGAFLMILTGCLPLRDAYRAMQANVLILIVGTIALGTAMEKTGTAKFYAQEFISLLKTLGPVTILAGLLVFTSLSTQLLSNNATAVLMMPIAVSVALELGVNPKPFIIAVCFGASACFATPVGYQTNLLVYGPGGYRFSDYLKLGIPLNLIVLIMGSIFIPLIWPL
ncbi:MAG: SLC13 family permease [Deltaproteobacteria bacterium]|nr:SLC13 family permease [Deltaproteobacteria bacterium]